MPFAAWSLLGIDLDVTERGRGAVRIGYLGDIDSRVLVSDVVFTAAPASSCPRRVAMNDHPDAGAEGDQPPRR